jgi:hypothetical protein
MAGMPSVSAAGPRSSAGTLAAWPLVVSAGNGTASRPAARMPLTVR